MGFRHCRVGVVDAVVVAAHRVDAARWGLQVTRAHLRPDVVGVVPEAGAVTSL